MKYSYGLIAEGEFNNGVLLDGPQDRIISAHAAHMSGDSTVGMPMSIGPMSVHAPGSVMQMPLPTPAPMQSSPLHHMQYNPMMGGAPSNTAQLVWPGSVCPMPMQHPMQMSVCPTQMYHHNVQQQQMSNFHPPLDVSTSQQPPDKPPIKEIKISK